MQLCKNDIDTINAYTGIYTLHVTRTENICTCSVSCEITNFETIAGRQDVSTLVYSRCVQQVIKTKYDISNIRTCLCDIRI